MASFEVWCPEGSVGELERVVAGMTIDGHGSVVPITPGKPLPPLQGGVCLWLGTPLLNHLKSAGLVKKNASLTASREQVYLVGEPPTKVLVSFDPYLTCREPERTPDLQWDVQLTARLARTGGLAPPVGTYRFVEDFSEAIERLQAGQIEQLALDLETLGLDPFAPGVRIISVSLTHRAGQADVYYVPPDGGLPPALLTQLRALICNPKVKVTGANLKFDAVWLAVHWGIEGINQTFDTHLVGSLLDENRSNSLEVHAKIDTAMGGYDSDFNRRFDKSRMDLVPKADLLGYAGGDTDACFRVTEVQRRRLTRDKRLLRFYARVLLPASKVFAKVERRGVYVNQSRYKELEVECRAELRELTAEALQLLPRRLVLKYADNLSLTRPALIRDFLFSRMGLKLRPKLLTEEGRKRIEAGEKVDLVQYAATSMEHVQMLNEHPRAVEFAKLLGQFSQANKTLSTYIVGFQKHIRADGMFHPTYRLGRGSSSDDLEGGTVTGRTSATDPAYQTITKRGLWAKRLRSVYPCPPGHGIAKLDYGQGELRIMACVARDPTMIAAYRTNTDLHSLTAAATMGLTLEQFLVLGEDTREEARRSAKAINFGLLYGMGAAGLVDYSRKSFGVDITLDKAETYRDAFFNLYNRLIPYHEAIKSHAHAHGQVRNPLGRIRHLPLINGADREMRALSERQAINSPIQSCLSDMMMLAMVEIDRRWPDLHIFGMTHDSLEFYLPLDGFMQRLCEVRDVLQELPLAQFGWEPEVKFVVDAEAALEGTLADVKKVKL